MQHRSTGSRLAAAVTAVLAVTALGAGSLAAAPVAFAAPAAATQDGALPAVPTGARVLATGPSGLLTQDDWPSVAMAWTPLDGGAPVPVTIPAGGGWASAGGDVLVLGDAPSARDMRKVSLRNMAAPGAPAVDIDLTSLDGRYVTVLGPDTVLAELSKPDDSSELAVVTKTAAGLTTKPVTGLPAGARRFYSDAPIVDGQVFVGHMASTTKPLAGGRSVIDIATASVVLTYGASEGGIEYGHLLFSPSFVAWYEREGTTITLVAVDRRVPERETKILGTESTNMLATLAGDWLVYGHSKGVRAYSLYNHDSRVITDEINGTTGLAALAGGDSLASGRRPDGSIGVFRLSTAPDNRDLVVTKAAEMTEGAPLAVTQSHVPATVDLDKSGGRVKLGWTLSRPDAVVDVTVTHTATGKAYRTSINPVTSGTLFSFEWSGEVFRPSGPYTDDAPNGAYTVEMVATQVDGVGEPVRLTLPMRVTRTPNPHDFNDNGSPDLLARDSSGVLWREDLRDRPLDGVVKAASRTRIGSGWNYRVMEAVGNIGGGAAGDLLALDGSHVLRLYLGYGDGTFTSRIQVGTGWNYDKLTGGSDVTGDGKADILATDSAGVLWLYKGTGSYKTPYEPRVKAATGWGSYNQITALGNIAGGAGGDVVARDTSGTLWLYLGNGDGTFANRAKVGTGWGAFSQLVNAGDVDDDGRPDLIAYGSGGTFLYRSTGSWSAPFTKVATSLYAGEGTKFTNVF
ncbi:FG-GAP repeat domain-containing protein [Streptomyces termitum]|uniref:FG-GAP repeat domain-containing protein n=1 Tax=Streptomyces termitum TaxID=67368 RepID=UPI0033A3EEFB